MKQPARIAILGLGLIGASLARAIKLNHPQIHIAAFDIRHDALAYAASDGFIDSHHAHAGQAAAGADIVVLACPPSAFATLAADIAPFLSKESIITDTLSVKRHAVEMARLYLPGARFVPGHPIAGSEQRGAEAGKADLFSGHRVILTPEEADLKSGDVSRVRKLWEMAGARVEYMPAELHDRIYAYVSHLPQLVAFASSTAMQELPAPGDEASTRFMRLMRSDAALWADICLHNADFIGDALADFATFASQMEGELSEQPAAGGADATLAGRLFPKVVATCLIATASLLQEVTGVHPARYAGSGFQDMTAPALADPDEALDAISSHHWVIARLLKQVLAGLEELQDALESGSPDDLAAALATLTGKMN